MNRFTRCSLSRPVRSLALALALTAAAPVSLDASGAAAPARGRTSRARSIVALSLSLGHDFKAVWKALDGCFGHGASRLYDI